MSERHTVGDYNIEVSGDELVVRDHDGTVVETIDLDNIGGSFSLPDGKQVDLAALILSKQPDIVDFEPAAGAADGDDPGGDPMHAPASFRPFADENGQGDRRGAAGALDDTSLSYGLIDGDPVPHDRTSFRPDSVEPAQAAAIPVTWARHDEWSVPENKEGGAFGRLVDGDPRDFTFDLSDTRFEVADGILQLKDGVSFDFETESFLEIEITATSRTGESKTQSVRIDVIDENEGQTGIDLDNASVPENAAGAVIGKLTVSDPDSGDSQTFQLSDSRFEVVNGQLKLKDGISLDFEAEPFVNVTVTATDQGGNSISQLFAIIVGDVNEAQTGIGLDGASLAENDAGAIVGTLTASDPDAGDAQAFTVSDDRFEVVGGQLKLKDGVSMDFETESSVDVTVTAIDQAGHSISHLFTIAIGDVNEAQTALSLNGAYVAENAAGAVIGNLTVSDPDAGDSQAFTVSDDRFEIVNGQLKLKDGVSLDFEAEPTVSVTVTAADKGGHSISEQFTLGVGDVNEAQTALTWTGGSIAENTAGAVAGTLWVADPDAGDSQTFTVSDSRFEVVNSQLKLKSGVSLDHETEPSVDVTVVATDKAGHQIQQTFTVSVTDVNEAPVVTAKSGAATVHIIDVNNTYQPDASPTVGGYLYSNDSAGVKLPSSSLLNGVVESNMTLTAPTEVTVTFQKEAAGNRNMVGTYRYDDSGNIIPGSVKFVWLDASATAEGKLGSSMVTDFLGYAQSNTVSLGVMEGGTHIGFFIVSNGASSAANRSLLTAATAGTATQTAAMDAIAGQLSVKVDANGNGHVFVGDTQMAGDVFFSHDKSLNTDFNGGSDIDHMASGVSSKLDNQLLTGVEDLNGGGARDFNDVVFSVSLGAYQVDKTTQTIVQPSVDFSDVDSNSLSQAVIQTTGFQAGDVLDVPASALFNVTVAQSGNDYMIVVTGKTGAETIDQYEGFVNAIQFSTTSQVEGDRQLSYSIVDEGGLSSNVGGAKITVSASYEVSSSELHPSQHALGAGNDHFYLNGSLKGNVDLGDGYDTLHLSRLNDGLSGSEKGRLQNLEEIDMTGYGTNQIALSIADVLDMTDGSHHLTVVGDKGDIITLSGDNSGHHWSVAGTNGDFTTYVWSDPVHQAVVEISNQLTATLSS